MILARDAGLSESAALPFAGVDGCAAGWLCVELGQAGDWHVTLMAQAQQLAQLAQYKRLMLVDMPIGLPGSSAPGPRQCDTEARRLLGVPRSSSVFPVPCRAALTATTYPDALRINRQQVGRGISQQAWNIAPKIAQLDGLLRRQPGLKSRLRECHPEVCFWALNGQRAMGFNKKRPQGRDERVRVLQRFLPQTQEILEYGASQYRRRDVANDDVIDALVVALTARLGYGRLQTLPAEPPCDEAGLAMEIVYADATPV